MVHLTVFQFQRLLRQGIKLGFCDVSCLFHLSKHHITTSLGAFVETAWVEVRRILAHAYQSSCFQYIQVFRFLGEISVGRGLDTNGIVQEVELVEIHGQDFLFRVISFKLDGNHPFDRLLHQSFHYTSRLFGIELLGQLLGNGTPPTCILLHEDTTLHDRAHQSLGINARMIGKTFVFRIDQRIDQMWRQVFITHINTIVRTIGIGTQSHSIV